MPYELNRTYTLAFSRFTPYNGELYIILREADTGSEKPKGYESSPWFLRVKALPFQKNMDYGEIWTQYKCKCIGYIEDTLVGRTEFPKFVQDWGFVNEKLYGNADPARPLYFVTCDPPDDRDGTPRPGCWVRDPQTGFRHLLRNTPNLSVGQYVRVFPFKQGDQWHFLSEEQYHNKQACKRRIEFMTKEFPENTEADCKVHSIDSNGVMLLHPTAKELFIQRPATGVLPKIEETVRVKCVKISKEGYPKLVWTGNYAAISVDNLSDLSLPLAGESLEVEYKSSLVYPVGATAPDIDKQLGQVIINTVAAMMNSKGGSIFIGVQDDGTVCGVEKEGSFLMTESEDERHYSPTCDGMQQKITNTVKKKLGTAAGSLVNVIPRRHPESQHLVLEIKVQANEMDIPVYVDGKELFARYPGETQHLYGEAAARFIVDRLRRLDEKHHGKKGKNEESVGTKELDDIISEKLPVMNSSITSEVTPLTLPPMVPFQRQYVEALDGFEGLAFDGYFAGPAKTWPDLFIELLKQLAQTDPAKFEALPTEPAFFARGGRPVFARTGSRIRLHTPHKSPLGLNGNIRVDRSFGSKENFLKDNGLFVRLVRHFGLKPEQFTIWVGKREQDTSVTTAPAVPQSITGGDSLVPTSQNMPAGHGQQLRVTFPDGGVVCEGSAILTLVKAIEKIGSKKVKQLGILSRGVPLVTDEKPDAASNRYAKSYRETGDGHYVLSYSGTPEKVGFLNQIATRLNVTLKVEII